MSQTSDDAIINQKVEKLQETLTEIDKLEKQKSQAQTIKIVKDKVQELKRLGDEQKLLISTCIKLSNEANDAVQKAKIPYAPAYLSILAKAYNSALDAAGGRGGDITIAFTGLIDTFSQRSLDSEKKDTKKKKEEVKQTLVDSAEKRLRQVGFAMGSFENSSLKKGKSHLPLKVTSSSITITKDMILEFISSLTDDTSRTDKTPSDHYLRHDIQNLKDTSVFYNYQIQLGGSSFIFKAANTSMTNVILDSKVIVAYFHKPQEQVYKLGQILQVAHTESFSRDATIILTFDDDDAAAFIKARFPQ